MKTLLLDAARDEWGDSALEGVGSSYVATGGDYEGICYQINIWTKDLS